MKENSIRVQPAPGKGKFLSLTPPLRLNPWQPPKEKSCGSAKL